MNKYEERLDNLQKLLDAATPETEGWVQSFYKLQEALYEHAQWLIDQARLVHVHKEDGVNWGAIAAWGLQQTRLNEKKVEEGEKLRADLEKAIHRIEIELSNQSDFTGEATGLKFSLKQLRGCIHDY